MEGDSGFKPCTSDQKGHILGKGAPNYYDHLEIFTGDIYYVLNLTKIYLTSVFSFCTVWHFIFFVFVL